MVLIGFYLITLVYSIIIHEVAHGVMALWLGDKTAQYAGRLNMNPLNHIDWFGSVILPLLLFLSHVGFIFGWAKPVPYNPYNLRDQKNGPLFVALAGPASNFILAFLAALGAFIFPLRVAEKKDILSYFQCAAYHGDIQSQLSRCVDGAGWELLANHVAGSLPSILFALLLMIISWNVILGTFNLFPIPPLDGSKILFFVFQMKDETIALFEQYGFMLLLFIILFFPYPISFLIKRMLGIFFGIAA